MSVVVGGLAAGLTGGRRAREEVWRSEGRVGYAVVAAVVYIRGEGK